MLIFNTTYTDSKQTIEINELVGKPFSFLERLRMNGVGSRRLIVHNVSDNFRSLMNVVSDINYASIELRPKGIIVHLTQQLNRFSWVIPYYKLVVFNATYFSIHSNGSFIQLLKTRTTKINKKFFRKMMDLKFDNTNTYDEFEFYGNR